MQGEPSVKQENNFSTFTEEVDHLREQVVAQEKLRDAPPSPPERQELIAQEVEKYEKKPSSEMLHPNFQMQIDEIEEEVVHLSAEHDKQVDQLVAIMGEKGLKNTLAVLERIGNYHVNDDFHRFLIQYLARGMDVPGLKEGSRLYRALNMRLFEVTLPEFGTETGTRSFSDLVRAMEQFYVGMMSLKDSGRVTNHFTIELALSNYSDDLVFYAAVPVGQAQLFEKQLMAAFPRASLVERKEDYNPFSESGATAASVAEFANHKSFPLKTFESFEQDPLNVILGTFSKLNKNGEGASIQLTIAPSEKNINQEFSKALDRVKDGEVLSRAFEGTGRRVTRELFSMASNIISVQNADKKEEIAPEVNQEAVEKIAEKMQTPILRTNLRLVASSGSQTRADQILTDIESAFNQFSRQQSNSFIFKRRQGISLKQLLHNFTFRLFNDKEELLLSTQELTTIMHFPVTQMSTPELKTSAILTAPAPVETSADGVLLGINNHRGNETEVRMDKEDRVRHFYVIGQTGTGKTTILKNMILQDIMNGDGVCYMDPHGTDIEDILQAVPEERMEDVIYFDPSDMTRPFGLNMLEYDPAKPEQKTFVVNEMLSIFNKLFDMKHAGGPMFEQYFRNATTLVIEDPASGSTLLDVSRVLADEEFRKYKLSRCKNPIVSQFWTDIAGKAGGEASLANMVPYITNKFDVFLSNDVMRLIVAQEKSSFNFRDVMDNRKILLVNLAKGRLGDINSNLIGLILVGKILMAALSRVDSLGSKPSDFYLYIDEFQNVTTDSISAILSEARKYRLSLNIAHQFIAQLPESIKDSVFGNVGSIAAFRIGAEDAKFLESQFAPTFSAADIMKIPNWNAYIKMLVNGLPVKPFNIATLPPPTGDPARAEQIKELSRQKYGQDRMALEKLVTEKYRATSKSSQKQVVRKVKTVASTPSKSVPQTRMVSPQPTAATPKSADSLPQQAAVDVSVKADQTTNAQTPPPIAKTPPEPAQQQAPIDSLASSQNQSPSMFNAGQSGVSDTPPSIKDKQLRSEANKPAADATVDVPSYIHSATEKKFVDDTLNENQLGIARAPREEKVAIPHPKMLTPEERQRLNELRASSQDGAMPPPVATEPPQETPLSRTTDQQMQPATDAQIEHATPEPSRISQQQTASQIDTSATEHSIGKRQQETSQASDPITLQTPDVVAPPPSPDASQTDPYREPID